MENKPIIQIIKEKFKEFIINNDLADIIQLGEIIF